MDKAIRLAIKGGYTEIASNYQCYGDGSEYTLDPLFWQAIGKAKGWENKQHPHWRLTLMREYDDFKNESCILGKRLHPWQAEMHLFIDHLANGKDIDSFFEDIL